MLPAKVIIESGWSKLWPYLSLMTMEPCALFFLVSYELQNFPQDQLIQDKICMQRFAREIDYCVALPKMSLLDDRDGHKSPILTTTSRFNMQINLITTVPTILVAISIGQFIDRYRNGKKVVLLVAAATIAIESTILLFNSSMFFELDYRYILLFKLMQGLIACPVGQLAVYWSYVSSVTPSHLRGLRLTSIMVCKYGAVPIASLLGGLALNQNPLFVGYEPRNYSTVYLLSIGSSLISFFLVLSLVNEQKDREGYRKYFPTNCIEIVGQQQPKLPESSSPWKIFFNIGNFKQMWIVLSRSRPHAIRIQLHMSMGAIAAALFCKMGIFTFGYQYTERMFNWSTKEYGYFQALSYTVNLVTSLLLAPVILKVWHMSDVSMSVIGLSMIAMQNMVRSLLTQLWIFELSIAFYSLNLLATVGLRSYISQIVDRNELGSIFSIVSIIESLEPLLSSIVLATIFSYTIDLVPALSFLPMAIVGTIGLALALVVLNRNQQTLLALQQQDPKQHP